MNLMPLSSKVLSLCVFLLGTTVSVYAHPNIDRSTATNPEGVLEIEPTAYPLAKALGASSHIHPTERVEETAAVASSKSESATPTPAFAGGDGTSGNPYQIATANQLNEVRNYLDKHFILIADINLDVAPYNTGEGWEPLGFGSSNWWENFTGNFNGNGYTIDGLFINRPSTDYVGLFGYTEGATIESVGLTNVDVTGRYWVGGLVGNNNTSSSITSSYAMGSVEGYAYVGGLVGDNGHSSIENSYATGSVEGDSYNVGGLVGWNQNSNITSSYATGNVEGTEDVGGLVGWNYESTITSSHATGNVEGTEDVGGLVGYSQSSTIKSSYASGSITGDGNVGGLVGYNTKSSITDSYATGMVTGTEDVVGGLVGYSQSSTIKSSYATGSVTSSGYGAAGGLVGYNSSSIIDSYATGSVTGTEDVGGLVGYNSYSSSSITDSYATGSVTGKKSVGGLVGMIDDNSSITSSYATGSVDGNYYVGGLVGWNYYSTITNSYATGSVTGNSDVGGFLGRYDSGTFTNNYWDTQSSGKTKGIGNGEQLGVTGKTSAQMTQQATFKGWDFSTVWNITENTTYPWLQKNPQDPAPAPVPPNPFAGGDGTSGDPYQIATATQLDSVRNYLNKSFILIADINLDVAPYNTGEGWEPIGNKKTRFTGNVNGNGHTIDGLFINRPSTDYVGLFGYTQGASIDSVGLTHGNVKGKNFAGGLAGYNTKSSITSSSATGKVKGKSRVGGLAGYNTKSSITTSYATGSVTGKNYVGGLVGDNTKSSSISDSYATGSVKGKKFVGGLAGYNTKSFITSSYATGSVTGKKSVGGFLGIYSSGSLTHNYWDKQSSGQKKGISNGKQSGVKGKTSAQMTKKATFKGWDFSTVWTITKNTTYPWLQKNPQEQPPKPSFDACCPMAKENTQAPDQPNSTEEEDTPKRLEVLQNYPNPFNPTTNIRFSLPEAGQVRLTVYTMMGQQVKQLANKPYQAGNHVVSFEAGNLASGMYLYQLWVNEKWVGTHKMTLIK